LAEWAGLAAGLAKCSWDKIKDLNRWASDLISEFILGILRLKSKDSNISSWIFNCGQTRISKSKLFEDFANLKLSKFNLNTQNFKSNQ
jgi:hypothetical protein